MTEENENKNTNEITITRVLDASRERVWKAWTEPEQIMRWWGPKGFTAPVTQIDLRVGGKYLSCMRSPDGKDFWSTGIFQEIAEPEKLVMTDSFADEHGQVVPATYYGMSPDTPLEMLITVTIEELDGSRTLREATRMAGQDSAALTESVQEEVLGDIRRLLQLGMLSWQGPEG